jgi:transposase
LRIKLLKGLIGLVDYDSLALQQDERFAMPWNETDREKYAVIRERYPSDLSDAEFAQVQPLLPAAKPLGCKSTDPRAVLNTLFYLVSAGCPWRCLPKDFPPFTTVQKCFYTLRNRGLWEQIVSVLVMAVHEAEGKDAAPTVVIVDSQSIKTTEASGPKDYDAGKKVKGRKRHIAVDTLGLPIKCQVTTADAQDRDALAPLLKAVSAKSPRVKLAFVDGGHAGDETQRVAYEVSRIRLTVVKRTDRKVRGFVVLPKCWVVERTLGWVNRACPLAKDFEALITTSQAWFMLSMAFLFVRRIARDYGTAA